MVGLEDLYRIAEAMDSQMLEMNIRHKRDMRDGLLITLEIPELDLRGIDEKLYERDNGTMVGYEPCDEVNVTVMGIQFKLSKPSEEFTE
jgi:hypothetical protein